MFLANGAPVDVCRALLSLTRWGMGWVRWVGKGKAEESLLQDGPFGRKDYDQTSLYLKPRGDKVQCPHPPLNGTICGSAKKKHD